MEITIYSKSDCDYCLRLHNYLLSKNIQFESKLYGKDFLKEEFQSEFGNNATFPQVIIGGRKVGGLKETIDYLVRYNLI